MELANTTPDRKVVLVAQNNQAAAQSALSQETDAHLSLRAFPDFYRRSYREVVRAAMTAGATFVEAEDAASKTFEAMLKKWPVNGAPLAYARKAVVSNFIQEKTRRAKLVRHLAECGYVSSGDAVEDPALSASEGMEQVAELLGELSLAQREVMERIAIGLTYEEIATDLGKSAEVVRRRVCDARARLAQVLNPDGTRAIQPRFASKRPPGRRIHE